MRQRIEIECKPAARKTGAEGLERFEEFVWRGRWLPITNIELRELCRRCANPLRRNLALL
jgi:hypothetical protein